MWFVAHAKLTLCWFLDDQLVMKQMSRLEFDAFLKFAPSYFNYMHKAFYQEV